MMREPVTTTSVDVPAAAPAAWAWAEPLNAAVAAAPRMARLAVASIRELRRDEVEFRELIQ